MQAVHTAEGTTEIAEGKLEVKDLSPLRHFELLSRAMGFDFRGEIRDDGLFFSAAKLSFTTEECQCMD